MGTDVFLMDIQVFRSKQFCLDMQQFIFNQSNGLIKLALRECCIVTTYNTTEYNSFVFIQSNLLDCKNLQVQDRALSDEVRSTDAEIFLNVCILLLEYETLKSKY